MVKNISAVIAAAGKGSRAKLPYPKTLHEVHGIPILIRIMKSVVLYDNFPTVIVSPKGKVQIVECLRKNNLDANIVIQEKALGMGNAVLSANASPICLESENILLMWGDIPFVQSSTLSRLVQVHFHNKNTFTFISRHVEQAYTMVKRDKNGKVIDLIETREHELTPKKGERDIGVFLFKRSIVMNLLNENLEGKYGRLTAEHGFLYIIKHLVMQGYTVEALPIASESELISLNKLTDLTS